MSASALPATRPRWATTHPEWRGRPLLPYNAYECWAWVAASGVSLTAAEEAVLGSVPAAALAQMAAGIGRVLCSQERRAFLQRAAAVLLLLGGAAGAAGCDADSSAHPSEDRAAQERISELGKQEAERHAADARRMEEQNRRPHPPTGIVPDLPPRTYPLGVVVQGALDPEQVRQSMLSQMAKVHRCYVTIGLAANPKLAGELRLGCAVLRDGALAQVAVTERYLNHPPTEKCVLEAVKAWRLPAPTDGKRATITFRLVFTPGYRRR